MADVELAAGSRLAASDVADESYATASQTPYSCHVSSHDVINVY